MNRYYTLCGNTISQLSSKVIFTERVIIRNMGDLLMKNHPVFPVTKQVIVTECDKNYIYYHLSDTVFPNVSNVYLYSHPCEPVFFRRFNKPHQRILLSDVYKRYKNEWAPDNDNVIIIPHKFILL